MFPDWSMSFRNLDTGDLVGHLGFADMGSDAFRQNARALTSQEALALLTGFHDDA